MRIFAAVLAMLGSATFLVCCTLINISPRKGDAGSIQPTQTCPVVASADAPAADVLFVVRLGPSTEEMGDVLGNFYDILLKEIDQAGVTVARSLIVPLSAEPDADNAIGYNCCSAPLPHPASAVLHYFSGGVLGPDRQECELAMVLRQGADLGQLRPSYPPEFLQASPPPPDDPIFTAPPTYVLVVFVDPVGRMHTLTGCQQQEVDAFTAEDAEGRLQWLNYPGQRIGKTQVFFLAIATSESGETEEDFGGRCLRIVGFPKERIDDLEPSQQPFFVPFVDTINRDAPGQARFLDICDAMGGAGPQALIDFIKTIHAQLGIAKKTL